MMCRWKALLLADRPIVAGLCRFRCYGLELSIFLVKILMVDSMESIVFFFFAKPTFFFFSCSISCTRIEIFEAQKIKCQDERMKVSVVFSDSDELDVHPAPCVYFFIKKNLGNEVSFQGSRP